MCQHTTRNNNNYWPYFCSRLNPITSYIHSTHITVSLCCCCILLCSAGIESFFIPFISVYVCTQFVSIACELLYVVNLSFFVVFIFWHFSLCHTVVIIVVVVHGRVNDRKGENFNCLLFDVFFALLFWLTTQTHTQAAMMIELSGTFQRFSSHS